MRRGKVWSAARAACDIAHHGDRLWMIRRVLLIPSRTPAQVFWCCAGGLENLLHHTGNTPAGRSSCDLNDMDGHPQINTVEADYLDYCCSVLQHL